MNIQGNINQLLTTAGVAAKLSPLGEIAERREEGKKISMKANIAQKGLSDIASNLENPKKEYTETELRDIESRVGEHNRNVYTAKTMAIPGSPYSKFVNTSRLAPQAEYRKSIAAIESNIAKRREALERMRSLGDSTIEQYVALKDLKKNIWEGTNIVPFNDSYQAFREGKINRAQLTKDIFDAKREEKGE